MLIENHEYIVNGQKYKSVTSILKEEGLLYMPHWIDSSFARMGTLCHAVTQARDMGKRIVSAPAEVLRRCDIVDKWKESVGFTPAEVEREVVNPVLGYAGTLDRLGWIDGEAWLIDYKFTNATAHATWHEYQTALYKLALPFSPELSPFVNARRGGLLVSQNDYRFAEHNRIAGCEAKAAAILVARAAKIEAKAKKHKEMQYYGE